MQLCILLNLISNEANKDKKKKKKHKKEDREKEKMPVLNRISTIKVLFAVLGDRELAKAVLTACNSQAQYLQPCQKVNHLQPGEGKNKVFPLPLPRSLLGKAKQSAAQYLLKETPRH